MKEQNIMCEMDAGAETTNRGKAVAPNLLYIGEQTQFKM